MQVHVAGTRAAICACFIGSLAAMAAPVPSAHATV
jgi:hypothetical protein